MWSNSLKKPNAPLRASSNALPGGETPNKIVTLINVCKHLPVLAKQSAKRKTSIFVNRANSCYLESRPERSEIVQTATVTDFDIRNSDAVSPTLVLLLCTWGWVAWQPTIVRNSDFSFCNRLSIGQTSGAVLKSMNQET